jgi:orotate phosphoribosyltransferase
MDVVDGLVQTQALRVAPAGKVFWYTSGTIGPYYINTHFLFGGAAAADGLLAFIDAASGDDVAFPAQLRRRVLDQLAADPVYGEAVTRLAARVASLVPGGVDWISGGERRDWFFSVAVAEHLQLPHLYLFKQTRRAYVSQGGEPGLGPTAGRRVAHVADLVTEASSYVRDWIPAIHGFGCRMDCSVNVVDRGQGGLAAIEASGVPAADALVRVDTALFADLRRRGTIGADQEDLLVAYQQDPHGAMRSYLADRPGFLAAALADPDPRTAARARLCVAQNLYGLDPSALPALSPV